MLELVVRSRLGRDGNNHASSSLVTHIESILSIIFKFLSKYAVD
jgi:hypothetical protein